MQYPVVLENGNSGDVARFEGESVKGLSPILSHVLRAVQNEIAQRMLRSDNADTSVHSSEALRELVQQSVEQLGIELTSTERDEVLLYLEQEQKPFGILQSLVDNPAITDIIISDYSKISAQEGRRNFQTDLSFPSSDAYEAFVEKLLRLANSSYSTKLPIADGMIGSYARIHAVHKSLCESGPYVTIRLNRYSSIAISDLGRSGLAPTPILDYLAGIVGIGGTILVVGEVGTGKTTLVRALASSIDTEESILVIEDTPEIKLEHPHVRYLRTRQANSDDAGRVSPSECIRAGMRMAMNRIIFGEMRDAEAAESFVDVCASGHPGLSTIHGRNAADALTRLELFLGRSQRGVARDVLSEQIATAVQVVVFLNICTETGRRRIFEVKELGNVTEGRVSQRDIFLYKPQNGEARWKVSSKISFFRNALESGERPLKLANLPDELTLDPAIAYSEEVRRTGAI